MPGDGTGERFGSELRAMKRKLLEGSLIVFGAAFFVRMSVALSPPLFHLPHGMGNDANVAMVVSAAVALAISLSLLAEKFVPWSAFSEYTRKTLLQCVKVLTAIVGAWLLVALLFFVYGFIRGSYNPDQAKVAPTPAASPTPDLVKQFEEQKSRQQPSPTPTPQVIWDDEKR